MVQLTPTWIHTRSQSTKLLTVLYIVYILRLIPGLGEDFAGAERGLEEGVRVDEAFPFRTPLPALLFPEPDLWEASVTW